MQASHLFLADSYRQDARTTVTAVSDDGIELAQTVFYATSGGQPGDTGTLVTADGTALAVVDTRKGAAPGSILHVLQDPAGAALAPGDEVTARIDWPRRHRLMRMHTCLHLLCRAVDGAVTGGQIGDGKGRLDFDIPEATLDKEALTAQLNAWIGEDHAIRSYWIDDEEFDRRPDLVRTMSVKPPRGAGKVRLVEIDGVDLQACGGTHVRSTAEIGPVRVSKIEKKGRQNRRVQVVFADPADTAGS